MTCFTLLLDHRKQKFFVFRIVYFLCEDTGKAKRKYLLKRVFISGDELKKNYPTVYKHKILYPLLFVYRPIKGAVTRPKGLIDEVKDVKKFKNRNK